MPASFVRRPVSPLHFEPLQPDLDDIICLGSDVEETSEQHRHKRRRVEEAGLQYLRGKSLYIASARLRGPFPDDWRNPFASKRRRIEVIDIASESESEGHRNPAQAALLQGHDIPTRKPIHPPELKVPPADEQYHFTTVNTNSNIDSQNSFVTATSEAPPQPGTSDSSRASRPQSKQWLKTGNIAANSRFKDRRSPTPSPGPRRERTPPVRSQPRSSEARDSRHRLPESAVVPSAKSQSPQQTRHDRTRYSGIKRPREIASPLARGKRSPRAKEPESNVKSPRAALSAPLDTGDIIALPTSTSLTEFEYRFVPTKASHSPERKSHEQHAEVAKKRARADRKRRLSFTASGGIRDRTTRESPPDDQHGSPPNPPWFAHIKHRVSPSKAEASPSDALLKDSASTSSPGNGILPEAQIAQYPVPKVLSGPSTELLETDKLPSKFPSTDNNDSYLGLSTPAAMLKAQQSFQKDVISPVTGDRAYSISDAEESGSDQSLPHERRDPGLVLAISPKAELATPFAISTQAMIDAVSPFAMTTAKKRVSHGSRPELTPSGSGSSSPLSPTAYELKSPSMSISPSPPPGQAINDPIIPLSALSKPASSITSFSIAPNGTMTEVLQQDGQQQQDYIMNDMDLDAAIEEAGSFLGEWNLEREARNQQRSTAGSKASTANQSRPILS
ncbi:MAG: hypothetical protein Q9220_002925 [cf. Caloplaca sp. 1 TL-2023]